MIRKLPSMHPGEVLREKFLIPLKLSAGALAAKNLPRTRIERIASKDVGITADTALRLAKALGTSPQLWLNLQTARHGIEKQLDKIEPVAAGHDAA
ncbi:MAG TPA: HigA family addiction module antitoxin [Pseudolabrys sp.]|nr:HigA family addiction module antitoxin [Pseudolabrys sp.]